VFFVAPCEPDVQALDDHYSFSHKAAKGAKKKSFAFKEMNSGFKEKTLCSLRLRVSQTFKFRMITALLEQIEVFE
jgi:hypothetical protein